MRGVCAADRLAQEVGEGVGRSALLLGAVPAGKGRKGRGVKWKKQTGAIRPPLAWWFTGFT